MQGFKLLFVLGIFSTVLGQVQQWTDTVCSQNTNKQKTTKKKKTPSQMVVAPWQLKVNVQDWRNGSPGGVRYRAPYGANNPPINMAEVAKTLPCFLGYE